MITYKQDLLIRGCDESSLSLWGLSKFETILFRFHAIKRGGDKEAISKAHFRTQGGLGRD